MPALRARRATSPGALPKAVCSSACPSPVMTRPAPWSLASRPVASTTRGAPGSRVAWRKATNPAPVPPAAPAPGRSSTPTTSPKRFSARSSSSTIVGSAPFCGPYTCLAPFGPDVAVLAAFCRDQRLNGSVATIGDRDLDDVRVGEHLAHAARDRASSLFGRHGALERVRRDDNFHGGGRPPPWSPLRCTHRLDAFRQITPGDGRSESGLQPHLV